MAYKLATAYVDVQARVKQANQQIASVKNSLMGLQSGASNLLGAFGVGTSLAAAIAASRSFIAAAENAVEVESRFRSVLRATGEAAGFNAKQIMEMVAALQQTTKFDDEALMGAATNLLKFDKVSGETFKRAMNLSTDLAQVGFGSVESASQALGRALQDPVRGLRTLRSVGIVLDKQQTKSIENMIKQGNIAKAQALILDMVASKAGGAAEAFAKTPVGQWQQLKNQLGDIAEEIGLRLLPTAIALGKAVLWAGQMFLQAFDFIAEWGAVIVTQWNVVQTALYHGFDFVGSAALDFLTHAFTAPFKALMDMAIHTFSAMPRLFEAAMSGGAGGLAKQFGKEFGDAMKQAMKTVGRVKLSDDTMEAAKHFTKAFGKLQEAKRDIERRRKEIWSGIKDMEPAKGGKIDGMIEHAIEFPSGLTGITDAWRNLQEAILKAEKDDPMEKVADGVGNIEDLQGNMLDEMVKLNKDGVKLQGVAVA
jgi:fructose-specific phosphotransferase system component IIB